MKKYIGLVLGILFILSLLSGCIESKHPDEKAREIEQEILQITPPDMDVEDALEILFQISDHCYLTVCNEELEVCFSRNKGKGMGYSYDNFHIFKAYADEHPRIRGRYKCRYNYSEKWSIFTFFREISTNPDPMRVKVGARSPTIDISISYDFILPLETSRDILTPYYLARGYGMNIYPKEDITSFLRIDKYPAPPQTSINVIEYNGQLLLWDTPYKFVPKTFTFLTNEMCSEREFNPLLLTFSIVSEEYPIELHIEVISHDDIEEYIYTINQSDEIISIQKI